MKRRTTAALLTGLAAALMMSACGPRPTAPEPAPTSSPAESPATVDSDGDGINDNRDKCPGTARDTAVDAAGCELDSDGDGVLDRKDRCPDTSKADKIDAVGCSLASRDKLLATPDLAVHLPEFLLS